MAGRSFCFGSSPSTGSRNNEDHFLVVCYNRALQTRLTNLPEGVLPLREEEVGYGMVVADGMGGMAAGEVASRLAIRTLINLALATPDWVMMRGGPDGSAVVTALAQQESASMPSRVL